MLCLCCASIGTSVDWFDGWWCSSHWWSVSGAPHHFLLAGNENLVHFWRGGSRNSPSNFSHFPLLLSFTFRIVFDGNDVSQKVSLQCVVGSLTIEREIRYFQLGLQNSTLEIEVCNCTRGSRYIQTVACTVFLRTIRSKGSEDISSIGAASKKPFHTNERFFMCGDRIRKESR